MNRYQKLAKRDKLILLADIADGLRPFNENAETFVRAMLEEPDPQVRAEAATCLWNFPDAKWIETLMSKARLDPNLDVRTRAISALGRYVLEGSESYFEGIWQTDAADDLEFDESDFRRVTEFLFNLAHDDNQSVEERRYAIEALAFLDDPEAESLIEWAYSQNDPRYKVSALFAMGRNGNLRWGDIILAELHSANRDVQFEAVRAAGELGLHEATEDLIRLARGRGITKSLRLRAIYSLGEAGDERAYPVLEELMRARDRDVREAAKEAAEEWLMITAVEELEAEEEVTDEDFEQDMYGKDIWNSEFGIFSKN